VAILTDIFMPIMDGFAADAAGSALLNVARARLVT
jgi:CheY-like chemotaxis protein